MYELIRQASLRGLFLQEGAVLVLAPGIAEVLFKFGSFLLEAIAFLIIWYLFGWIGAVTRKWIGR